MSRPTISESRKNELGDEQTSTASGAHNPLREILYLDLARVSSYLSQLEGGLTDYLERVRAEGGADVPSSWGATGGLPVISGRWGSGSKIGVSGTTLIQRKQSHHAALNTLVSRLESMGLLGNVDSGSPFVTVHGNPILLDYEKLAEDLANYKKLVTAINYFSSKEPGSQKVPQLPEEDVKSLRTIAETLFKQQLDLLYLDQQPYVRAPIDQTALLTDRGSLPATYGNPVRLEITVLGLRLPDPINPAEREGPPRSPLLGLLGMAEAFAMVKRVAIESPGLVTVVPLAAYTTLFSPGE